MTHPSGATPPAAIPAATPPIPDLKLHKEPEGMKTGQKIAVAMLVISTVATVFGILSMYLNILPEDYTKYAGIVFLGGCTLMAGSIIYLTKDWSQAKKFAIAVGIIGALGGIYGTLGYFNTVIHGFNLDQVGHTGSALIAIGGAFMLGGSLILAAIRKKDEEEDKSKILVVDPDPAAAAAVPPSPPVVVASPAAAVIPAAAVLPPAPPPVVAPSS